MITKRKVWVHDDIRCQKGRRGSVVEKREAWVDGDKKGGACPWSRKGRRGSLIVDCGRKREAWVRDHHRKGGGGP